MSRFEYNFTRENEFQQLQERNIELQNENQMLKKNLEELIRVNNELTESIDQFNNDNTQGQLLESGQTMQAKVQALSEEIEYLRGELVNAQNIVQHKSEKDSQREAQDEQRDEGLFHVIEELIKSFKKIQSQYEEQIRELNTAFQSYRNSFETSLSGLDKQCRLKLQTVASVITQLKKKDDTLAMVEQRLLALEERRQMFRESHGINPDQFKALNALLQEKNRIIQSYMELIANLKAKFIDKNS